MIDTLVFLSFSLLADSFVEFEIRFDILR